MGFIIITANDMGETGAIANGVNEKSQFKPFDTFQEAQDALYETLTKDFGKTAEDFGAEEGNEDDCTAWETYQMLAEHNPRAISLIIETANYERYGYRIIPVA